MKYNQVFKAASQTEVTKRQERYPFSACEGAGLPVIMTLLPSLVLDQVSECQPLESCKSTVFYVDVIHRGWNWRYVRSQIRYYWAKWTGRIMH